VAVAVGLAVVLFFVLGNASEEEPEEPAAGQPAATTPAGGEGDAGRRPSRDAGEPRAAVIEVEGGQPVGGVQELEFEQGEEIRFVVRSDVADHVHLHGYDVFEDVAAGGEARFEVPATIEGVFEVELEDRAAPLAEISVTP
jgi:hypothetical protein